MPRRKILFIGLVMVLLLLALSSVAVLAQEEDLGSEQCQACHSEQYTTWEASMHGTFITEEKIPSLPRDSCLECHSLDYRLAPEDAKPAIDAVQYGITCVLCHGTHETPGDEATKVADVYAQCAECHTADLEEAEFTPGQTVHHPMKEMFDGRGGIGVASVQSVHLNITSCVTCHTGGHNFHASQESCDLCHGGNVTIEEVTAEVGAELEALGAKLEAVKAALGEWETAETDEQKAYDTAYTNYTLVNADASKGVHNHAYAEALLEASNATLATVEVEVEATPAELPTTGGAMPGALPFIVSGVSLLALGVGTAYVGRRKH